MAANLVEPAHNESGQDHVALCCAVKGRSETAAAALAEKRGSDSTLIGPMARVLIALIRVYQWTLSPWLGSHCRFEPSCSRYSVEALSRYGFIRGGWLTLRRLSRCRPGGGHGYDPVP